MVKLWYYKERNFDNAGDYYGKWLLDRLGVPNEFSMTPDIITVGSILNRRFANNNFLVWGSGYHNPDEKFNGETTNRLCAVRGKLSRAKTPYKNISVGDPGILAGLLYTPTTIKKYKFGIISHYWDIDEFKKLEPEVKVIDMRTNNIEKLLDEINECEFIFSSSLHGIIFSHSLGIPAVHLENKPLYSRENFKFKDYYSIYDTIEYVKEKYEGNLSFVNKYLNEPEKYIPSRKELSQLQYDLLCSFPYEIKDQRAIEFINEFGKIITPKVSIIIPAYNSASFIEKCLDSIPERKDIEVIVVNDCSTDNTLDILNIYPNKWGNYLVLSHATNKGPGVARQTGLDKASGYYIYFGDSDDWFYKENYDKMLDFIFTYPACRIDQVAPMHTRNDGRIEQHVFRYSINNTFIKRRLVNGFTYSSGYFSEDCKAYEDLVNLNPGMSNGSVNLVTWNYNIPREFSLTDIRHRVERNVALDVNAGKINFEDLENKLRGK